MLYAAWCLLYIQTLLKNKNLFNRRFHRAGNIHSQLRFGAVFGATLVYQRVGYSALKKEPEKARQP